MAVKTWRRWAAGMYLWPWLGTTGIAEQLHVGKLDLLQGVGGPCCRGGIWAGLLRIGDGLVVDLYWRGGDGVDLLGQGSGEGVGHHVIHPADVQDVTGELGHLAEVPALSGGPGLHRLGQDMCEGLVVHVEGEFPPLQHEPEVPYAQHAGQELPVVSRVPPLGAV